MNRGVLSVNAGELRVVVTALAIVIWAFAAFNSFTPGMSYRTGPFKGADFVHFYVLGNLVTEGRADLLYDSDAQRSLQSQLVPISKGYWFLPVYGPQTALLFAGLARLPYLWAALVWALLTIAAYVWCAWAVWRHCPSLRAHDGLMLPAALGFVPLYVLATSGQTSVLPLVCLTAAFLAFKADNKWWAGVALGSIVIKPHFGIAAAVVVLLCREWRVIGGAVGAVVVQWGVSILYLGTGPFLAYLEMLKRGPSLAAHLEPEMQLLHSLRAFWLLLLPGSLVSPLMYVLTSVAIIALTARLWRSPATLEYRYSALVLATVLVSPHVGTYDLVLVAPAAVLTAGAAEAAAGRTRHALRAVLWAAYFVPMAGVLTRFSQLQLTTVVLAAWLLTLYWAAFEGILGQAPQKAQAD